MPTANLPTLESQIIAEITAKDRAIRDLQQELATLQRLLISVRDRNIADRATVRTNSIRRVSVEEAILQRLRQNHPWPVDGSQLWTVAQQAGIASKATFRSHLHRLKQRGLIMSADRNVWTVPNRLAKQDDQDS